MGHAPSQDKSNRQTPRGRLAILVLGGLMCGLVFAEFSLYLLSETYLARRDPLRRHPVGADNIRVLCLGESTTAGLNAGPGKSYPAQLTDLLNARHAGRTFTVVNRGIPGIDTDRIATNMESLLADHDPHIVVTMMGINDGPLDSDEFQVGGGLRIWKLARLMWMVLSRQASEEKSMTWASAFAENSSTPMRGIKVREAAELEARTHPDDPSAQAELGKILIHLREPKPVDTARATSLLDSAHREAPCSTDAAVWLAYHFAEEHPERGRRWARTAIGCAPDSPSVRGVILGRWFALTLRDTQTSLGGAREAARGRENTAATDPFLAMLEGLDALRAGAEEDALAAFGRVFAGERPTAMTTSTYSLLVSRLAEQGHAELAERLLGFALETRWPNERAIALCEFLKKKSGDEEGSRACAEARREMRARRYNEKTRRNYGYVRRLLRERGIPLVAVQYPKRDVQSLKRLLGEEEGVYYVSNEENFGQAEEEHGAESLFVDRFAGDFGHMTPEGNRLVADAVANVILREVVTTEDKEAR